MSWEPPPEPDLERLTATGFAMWEMDKPTLIAFDTETSGLTYADHAFCATVAWWSNDVIQGVIPAGHYFELSVPGCIQGLERMFSAVRCMVGHNLKFDLHRAEAAGFFMPEQWDGVEFHDTEAMSHLDDEHRPKGLKDLMVSVLGEKDTILVKDKEVPREKWEIDKAKLWAKKKYGLASVRDVGYDLLPRGTVVPYAIRDAVDTLRLAAALHPKVTRYDDLAQLYQQEMMLTRTAIYDVERYGMKVDRDYVKMQIREYRKKVLTAELAMESLVGKPVRSGKMTPKERPQYFNPSSNDEIGEFFRAVGEVRDNYDAEQLETVKHPLAPVLLSYRKDRKLLDTYFLALDAETGDDGVFHQSSRQHGTVTGRTSGGKERGDR